MENFRTLKILDFFQKAFEKMGIDYGAMRKILQIKLMMDRRRVPTIFKQYQAKNKKEGNPFYKLLWLYAFYGLTLIPFIVSGENYIFQMSIAFSITMFIIMTSMISDFSSVLLDVKDKHILSTKPITSKTINAAKFIHVSIYLFFLTASFITIPAIIALIKHGVLFFLLFILEMVLVNLFIVVITALSYFVVLKFFDGERLKDVINYVQILLSASLVIGYQLVFRSFEFFNIVNNYQLTIQWWQFFIPPIWFAAPFELFFHGKTNLFYIIFTTLAYAVPILSIFIYIKLMPSFEKNLEKLSEQGGGEKNKDKKKDWLANILCHSREERTFYRFANTMMGKEREFKLRVYPSLGFSLIIPFLFFYNEFQVKSLEEIAASNWFLTIYSSLIIIPTVVMMLRYSGRYKGAWIYKTTPIKDTEAIYKGTLKAFLIKLFLPVFFVESIIFSLIFKAHVVPHLVVVFFSASIFTVICFKFLNKTLPFSDSFKDMQQKSEGWKIFTLFFIILFFAGIHLISMIVSYGVYIYLILLLLVNLIIWKNGKLFRTTSFS